MLERYDGFWARYLGVSTSQLNEPGVSVAPHVGLKGYNGVWFFRRNRSIVASAPNDWVPTLRERLHGAPEDELMNTHFLRKIFGSRFDRVIGPAFQGCLGDITDDGEPEATVCAIGASYGARVASFRSRCGQQAWEYSGLDEATGYLAAVRVGEEVVSLAGYRAWTKEAGDVCMLTSTSHRRRGFATSAARAVVRRALQDEKLMLYQTLESNTAALKIAGRLGYAQYASHVAVRLQAPHAP